MLLLDSWPLQDSSGFHVRSWSCLITPSIGSDVSECVSAFNGQIVSWPCGMKYSNGNIVVTKVGLIQSPLLVHVKPQ